MKTLPEILDDLILSFSRDELLASPRKAVYTLTDKDSALKAIAKELMGCLPEKYRITNAGYPCPACNAEQGELHTDCPIEHAQKITKVAHDSALDEVRARLTAFIGHKEK